MTIKAHFDGKVFVPEEPVDLPSGQSVNIPVPRRRARGGAAEIAKRLRKSPLKKVWDDIAAGRDSTEVARYLRKQASRREH